MGKGRSSVRSRDVLWDIPAGKVRGAWLSGIGAVGRLQVWRVERLKKAVPVKTRGKAAAFRSNARLVGYDFHYTGRDEVVFTNRCSGLRPRGSGG